MAVSLNSTKIKLATLYEGKLLTWFWLAITASALWGLSYVVSQYLLDSFTPIQLLWLSSVCIFTCLSLYVYFTNQYQTMVIKLFKVENFLLVIAYAGLYFLASISILRSISLRDASLAAIIESSYPVFTLFFSYLLLRQAQFNLSILVGFMLIISGIVVINLSTS